MTSRQPDPTWIFSACALRLPHRTFRSNKIISRMESSIDNLNDESVVITKLTSVLDRMRGKFGDKYKHVKLTVAFPALLQLVAQAQTRKSSKEEWRRDLMFKNAGSEATKEDLKDLDQDLDFADWAYLDSTEELKQNLSSCGYSLLKHEIVKAAGFVGYYVAIDGKKKVAIVGVKGTSSLDDVITDCCAKTVTHQLEGCFMAESFSVMGLFGLEKKFTEIHCHEGILLSAKRLAEDLKPFVENLFVPLGYEIRVCGHSLGAGASSLVAILLRSQIPELIRNNSIKVRAFASPPVLDYAASIATTSFITTIVNNSDMIPRLSLNNMEIMMAVMAMVQTKLEEAGCEASDIKSTYAFLKKINQGTGGEMLMTTKQSFEILEEAQNSVVIDDPDNLYCPGKIILLYTKWQDEKRLEEERIERGEAEINKEDMAKLPAYCKSGNCVTKSLRAIELDEAMVPDHFAESYRKRIKLILR